MSNPGKVDGLELLTRDLEVLAYRMGLKPWETERLTPLQIQIMWDAFVWRERQVRDMVANTVHWLRTMMDSDTTFEQIRESYGGMPEKPEEDD